MTYLYFFHPTLGSSHHTAFYQDMSTIPFSPGNPFYIIIVFLDRKTNDGHPLRLRPTYSLYLFIVVQRCLLPSSQVLGRSPRLTHSGTRVCCCCCCFKAELKCKCPFWSLGWTGNHLNVSTYISLKQCNHSGRTTLLSLCHNFLLVLGLSSRCYSARLQLNICID